MCIRDTCFAGAARFRRLRRMPPLDLSAGARHFMWCDMLVCLPEPRTLPERNRSRMIDLPRGNLHPVLPLRDIVVFPHMIVPLFVGRDKSVRALEDVMKDDKQILLVTQKNAAQDDPTPADIYSVGTIGTVLQLLK